MLINNSKKIVIKLGSSTVVDKRGNFKKNWVDSLIKDINAYSFALKPEEHQPSGTCNFSRIDNAQFVQDTGGAATKVYAVNYNVLRIMSGMGGMAYSN